MTRVRAPWSWRTLASMRRASSESTSPSVSTPGLANETAQDGQPGREVGWLDGDRQAPLEAVAQAGLEVGELAGDAVGGEDHLAPAFVERVEGVEELVLGVALALEELDVVDEQHVEVAVAALEPLGALCAQRGDELAGEGLGGRVADAETGRVGGEVVGDRDQEVGLAEAGRAVEEERVVGLRRRLGDGQGRRVGDPVSLADDEAVEGVVGVEVRSLRRDRGLQPLSSSAAKLTSVSSEPGRGKGLAQQARVAPLGPGPDALRGREVEHARLGADDRERLQPELERRRWHGRAQASLDVLPEGVEILFRRVTGHQRPTIAATGGMAEIEPPANAEERFRHARGSAHGLGPRPYTATPDEADLSAEEAEAGEDARFPGADEHARRPGDSQAPAP